MSKQQERGTIVSDARKVLVTGAGGRIGAAIVGAFASLGDRVAATDLDSDKLTAKVRVYSKSGRYSRWTA